MCCRKHKRGARRAARAAGLARASNRQASRDGDVIKSPTASMGSPWIPYSGNAKGTDQRLRASAGVEIFSHKACGRLGARTRMLLLRARPSRRTSASVRCNTFANDHSASTHGSSLITAKPASGCIWNVVGEEPANISTTSRTCAAKAGADLGRRLALPCDRQLGTPFGADGYVAATPEHAPDLQAS